MFVPSRWIYEIMRPKIVLGYFRHFQPIEYLRNYFRISKTEAKRPPQIFNLQFLFVRLGLSILNHCLQGAK